MILPRKRKSMTMSPTMQPLSLLPATTTETKGTEELIYFETTETKGCNSRGGTTQRVERKQRERAMQPRGSVALELPAYIMIKVKKQRKKIMKIKDMVERAMKPRGSVALELPAMVQVKKQRKKIMKIKDMVVPRGSAAKFTADTVKKRTNMKITTVPRGPATLELHARILKTSLDAIKKKRDEENISIP